MTFLNLCINRFKLQERKFLHHQNDQTYINPKIAVAPIVVLPAKLNMRSPPSMTLGYGSCGDTELGASHSEPPRLAWGTVSCWGPSCLCPPSAGQRSHPERTLGDRPPHSVGLWHFHTPSAGP